MPVLAALLADVLRRDTPPPVALRLEHHLLDQAPVAVLDPGAVGQRAAGIRDPARQLVAELLELRQRQQPRPAAATADGRVRHVGARPGGAEDRRELAL